ncbi:MAG: hypothetical protein P8X55_10650, partial [Desulfosarcinaceae bacterium]
EERRAAARIFKEPTTVFTGDKQSFIDQMENALHAAPIITYAQGMELLRQASQAYGYGLNLETVARIWTGGCIIRARLLEDSQTAFRDDPGLANLVMAPVVREALQGCLPDLRSVVGRAAEMGIPVPGLMMALAYHDAYRSQWLPANLVMAQRDYFGSHTYQRIDAEGTFHTQWEQMQRK